MDTCLEMKACPLSYELFALCSLLKVDKNCAVDLSGHCQIRGIVDT